MAHRLTPAQRRMIVWIRTLTSKNTLVGVNPVYAVRHKNKVDGKRETCGVLVREGYLEYGEPNKYGTQVIKLTAKAEGI